MDEDFTPEDIEQIRQIIKASPKQAPAPAQPDYTSSAPAAQNPLELELMGQQQQASQFVSDIGQGISDFGSAAIKKVGQAASAVGDFVTGPGVPVPVQLPSSSNPVRQKGADGQELQRYSDGKWYPVGTTFKKSEPLGPLQETEVINGVTYKRPGDKYVRVK